MKTPEKGGNISGMNPLDTPRTQASTAMKSAGTMKQNKSPNTQRMDELTMIMNSTSLNFNEDSLLGEPLRTTNNTKKK